MKVEKLTKKQEALVPVYRDKWLKIGRSVAPIDKEETIKAINWLYEFGGKEKPYMWFCDSPMQIQLLINILKKEGLLEKKNNLWNNFWNNLWNNFWNNLRKNLGDNLENNLWSNLRNNLWNNFWNNLWNNLRNNLENNLGNNLRNNLKNNLRNNLWSNLRNNLGNNLGNNLWNNLWNNLENNLWNNLGNNLENNLWNNLGNNFRNNLGNNLWDNKLEFSWFLSPNTESWWVGFYDFILHEIFPERVSEFEIFSKECRHYYQNTYLITPFEGICFISERPTELHIDEETGFLHNPNGSAIKFKDGYEFYAVHNVRVDKEMLSYNPTQIMTVNNVEQRLVLIKNYGVENMLDKLDSKVIDTFKEYRLHSVLLEGEREMLLEMQNPSEPKKHFEFVPPKINTCQKAMAWRFGLDLYINPVMKA